MILSKNTLAIKRINKDMREITKNPVEGIGIASIDDDPMRYVINLKLMSGPYEGYCIQLLLTFSDNYPTRPPKILIYPGQALDSQYHHHIFDDYDANENGRYFKKFCFDLLDNDFMSTSSEKSGWNPSYSISSLLLQVQNFISDPDGVRASQYQINELMKSMDNYSRTFYVNTEQGRIQKVHTWKNPYPEIFFKNDLKDKNENQIIKDVKNKENEKEIENEHKMLQIKENLNCFILKVNYIDDPNILLGYPIIQKKGKYGRNKIELYPIPELLTYEGFTAQIGIQGHMADIYFNFNQFKSANNEYYNNWVPIYINKDHYEKNKNTILNSFRQIVNGNLNLTMNMMHPSNLNGNNNNNPEYIFQVLPIILNSMIIGMFNGNTQCSSSFIRCYFQFILLFKKLSQEFEGEYLDYLNTKFNEIKNNNYIVNKQIIPDIGNFFMLLIFCSLDVNTESMKKIYKSLFEDSLARQMFWMFHGEEGKDDMKKLLLKNSLNDLYFKKFEENNNFKMRNLDKFNQDLHKIGIFEQIVSIISNDKGFLDHIFIGKERAKGQVEIRMNKSFKRLYCECSREGKNQIKELIIKNLKFSDYFDASELDDKGLYDSFRVDEMLKNEDITNKDEIIKYGFKRQRGNQLYLISFFAQKKVEEPGFLEELEKNYGVYLDVENFIKEMKQKLEEIKTYKDLYAYIGTDFGKDKTNIELIIEAYGKAKEKRYIKPFNKSLSNSLNSAPYMLNPIMNRNNTINRRIYDNRYEYNIRNRRSRSRGRSRSRSSYNSSYYDNISDHSRSSRSRSSRSRSRNRFRNSRSGNLGRRNRYYRHY